MRGKRIRGNNLYINEDMKMSYEILDTEIEERTRLVVEEDTIYEIDLCCEKCKERERLKKNYYCQ